MFREASECVLIVISVAGKYTVRLLLVTRREIRVYGRTYVIISDVVMLWRSFARRSAITTQYLYMYVPSNAWSASGLNKCMPHQFQNHVKMSGQQTSVRETNICSDTTNSYEKVNYLIRTD